MAGLKLNIDFQTNGLYSLVNKWGGLKANFMSNIGKQARLTLKRQLLSGQTITLHKDMNKLGKYNIRSRVGRGANSVSISSPPINLFERGRTLRSGQKEAGKRIITSKLKTLVDANMGAYISKAEKDIEREFSKV